MTISSTAANAWLKEYYEGQYLQELELKDYPTLAIARKRTKADFGTSLRGRYTYKPVITAPGGSGGSVMATAWNQGLDNAYGQTTAFEIPPVAYYNMQPVSGIDFKRSMGTDAAFVTAMQLMVKNAVRGMKQDISRQIYGTQVGVIGQISAITTTTVSNDTITLTFQQNARNFYPGKTFIEVRATNTTGVARTQGTTNITNGTGMQVLSVPRVNANIVFAQSVTDAALGIPGLSVGDYVFNAGDAANLAAAGIPAWNPYGGALVGDSFFNVNRFNIPFLQGYSYDATGGVSLVEDIEDALSAAETAIDCHPNIAVCNSNNYNKIKKYLQSQNRYTTEEDIMFPTVGFDQTQEEVYVKGVMIGDLVVVKDNNVGPTLIQCFKADELELLLLNDGFEPWELDGQAMVQVQSPTVQDALMMRFGQYWNVTINPQNCLSILTNAA